MRRFVTPQPSDSVLQFGRVLGSSVSPDTGALLLNVEGIGPDSEQDVEGSLGVEVYSGLGLLGRPLPPDSVGGVPRHMETLNLRTADALVPHAARDVRIRMGGRGPAPGTVALAGYGGGFYSLSAVGAGSDPAGGGTVHLLYCPYDFDASGTPRKAHAVVLDPTPGNESVQVIHGSGMAVTMQQGQGNPVLIKNAAGDATLRLDDQGVTVTAGQVVVSGGVVLGEPAAAVSPVALAAPLVTGVLTPLLGALTALATNLSAVSLTAAAGGALTTALGPLSAALTTVPATKVNAS